MLEIILAGAVAFAALGWLRQARRTRRERRALVAERDDCSHDAHELVDVRSNVFAPNELVATLCVTCDKQLGPEVWKRKYDDELAALEAPDGHSEPARSRHSRTELEKLGFRWSGKSKVPGSDNMLAHFVCTKSQNGNHKLRLILHDKAHLSRFLAYKGFGELWDGDLDHMNFAVETNRKLRRAADAYIEIRPKIASFSTGDFSETVHFSAGGIITSDTIYRAVTTENEKLSEQIARLTGIPESLVGKMPAIQAAEALNLAQSGVPAEMIWEKIPGWTPEDTARAKGYIEDEHHVEIWAWGSSEPIVTKRIPGGAWG